jgi:chemotaxis-related protein WspD
MSALSLNVARDDCWNRIGVWGDHACPELVAAVHCHNCPVFAAAGRQFLDAPSPAGYLEDWAGRLAAPPETVASELESMLIFRLADEWLALSVPVLVEVTAPRPVHRIPYRGGVLAGLINIRGELHLCARLDQLLGIARQAPVEGNHTEGNKARMLVVRREQDAWVFPVDEVACVYRFAIGTLMAVPPTLARAVARFTRGVTVWNQHAVGCLDDARLFETLRARTR